MSSCVFTIGSGIPGWRRPCHRHPTTVVPRNYAPRLIGLRRRLRLTQAELAQRIGAANKAVIYQWETLRGIPSITFWKRVEELTAAVVSSS